MFYNDGWFWHSTEISRYDNKVASKTKNGWKYEIEVPGFDKESLTIEIDGVLLIIKGEKEGKVINKLYSLTKSQRECEIEAKVKNGLLTLTFIEPFDKQSKKIEIK